MTGRKSKASRSKAPKAGAAASKSRKTTKAADKKGRSAANGSPRAAKVATASRKAGAAPSPRKAPTARAQSAAPLLARSEKKVGPVEKAPHAAKPTAGARYHPKTEPPAAPAHVHGAPMPAFGFLGLAQPWMTLGWRMTATGLAMQARMAKAALDIPLATTAMRQGAEAFNAWLALAQRRTTKVRET